MENRIQTNRLYLDGGEHDGRVGVRETRSDTLTDGLRLPIILRNVVGHRVEDEHLSPSTSVQYISDYFNRPLVDISLAISHPDFSECSLLLIIITHYFSFVPPPQYFLCYISSCSFFSRSVCALVIYSLCALVIYSLSALVIYSLGALVIYSLCALVIYSLGALVIYSLGALVERRQ